jgi:hypothetical protein
MQLRRDAFVPVITTLVILVALAPAIVDTVETGRVYLFSRQFLDELPRRFTGPGRIRFLLQPAIATLLGVRGGLADAREGGRPYLHGLLLGSANRRELLRSGLAAIRNLLAMGIILDLVFQLILYRSVHPGAALVLGPILICLPYAISRALTNRVATWSRRWGETT